MSEFLEVTVDKFTFKVAADRFYTREGVWVQFEADRGRIGLSDFLQQRSGDIAFAEIKPIGTMLAAGDEVASIETIKVDIALNSPIGGSVIEVNPAMILRPKRSIKIPMAQVGWRSSRQPIGRPIDHGCSTRRRILK